MNSADDRRWREIRTLRRTAPRDWYLRGILVTVGCAMLGSWAWLDLPLVHPVTGRSLLTPAADFWRDVTPHVLPTETAVDGTTVTRWEWAPLWRWMRDGFVEAGAAGLANTLAMSVLSIVLAALLGALFVLPASRVFTIEGGFVPADRGRTPLRRIVTWTVFSVARFMLIVLRSIPEFVLAFLFLLLFGPVMLPGILALGLHNAGILGKLSSERVEDMNPDVNRALAALGADTGHVCAYGVIPRLMPQFLVYFFYRFETCLREAAILGILGLETIGFHIHHEFAQFHYDDALLFVAMNSVLIIAADHLSAMVRRRVRGAGMAGV